MINNMALIAPVAKNLLISPFNKLSEEYPGYCEYIPEVTEDTIRMILGKISMKVKSKVIVDLAVGRYSLIKRYKGECFCGISN